MEFIGGSCSDTAQGRGQSQRPEDTALHRLPWEDAAPSKEDEMVPYTIIIKIMHFQGIPQQSSG